VTAPGCIVTSMLMNCCVPTFNARALERLEALQSRFDLVGSRRYGAETYWPTSFETVDREMLVASLVSITSTPGIKSGPGIGYGASQTALKRLCCNRMLRQR